MPKTTRQDIIKQAIAIMDAASPADLTACLAQTEIHDHLKNDPAELRRLLDVSLSTGKFDAWKAAQQILEAANGKPMFAGRDYDMRNWPADELTVDTLLGVVKDMGWNDDPFVVTTDAGVRVRLLGVRRLDPAGVVDLVVSTPEPVLPCAVAGSPVERLAQIHAVAEWAMKSPAGRQADAWEQIVKIFAG